MNPPLTFANALTQLSLLTSQTTPANFTFTSDELTQALQTAWNDPYVVKIVWDSSLTYSVGTWQYPIPATLGTIREIYIQKTSDSYPEKISPDLYEIVGGNIQFFQNIQNFFDDTFTLYLKGAYKLATTDSLTTTNLVNYVIAHATEILLNNLMLKKAFYFLKTDTTMADILRAKQDATNNTLRWRQALQREFESA